MRIGINAALQSTRDGYRQTGISRYISELVNGLESVKASDDRLILLGKRLALFQDSPIARMVWEQTGLPLTMMARGIDVFHGPISVVPYLSRRPSVVTVHDLAFLKFPEQLPRNRRRYLIAATRLSARKAEGIITVSQSTADDLQEWLNIPAEKVHPIPLAPSPRVKRVADRSLDIFRMKWDLERPYVLAVGTLEPRKNLPTLLRAFAKIKDDVEHQLVLVGPEGWLNQEMRQTLDELSLGDRVRLTGFVSDEELGGWYSGADLFAFPSFYEGFGLPTVEAMRCGAPVLASNTSAFPEVIGDAGVMISPYDIDAWAENLRDLLHDERRRNELREKGLLRANEFSWGRTAQQTYDLYASVAR